MNIQDIADFIDLVKNPVKYEKVLQNIKDEQDRLNAVIATVAEASELGALRKEVETKAANLDSAYAEKAKKLEQEYTRKLKKVDTLQAEVEAQLLQAQAEIESAVGKQRAADELANSFSGRDKKLIHILFPAVHLFHNLIGHVSRYSESPNRFLTGRISTNHFTLNNFSI